jgi:hypothetical protein
LGWACEKTYCHYTEEVVLHVKDFGKFFPEVYKNPGKYLQRLDSGFIQLLKDLRAQGKFLFILTNSHWWMAEMILNYIFGKEWASLWDLVIVQGGKPLFWRSDIVKPFYSLDLNAMNLRGAFDGELTFDGELIGQGKVLVWGNTKYLERYFDTWFGQDWKGIYVGDSPHSDCGHSLGAGKDHWDAGFIFEELIESELSGDEPAFLGQINDYRSVWGSALVHKTSEGKAVDTLMYSLGKKSFAKCWSSVFSESFRDFFSGK